MRRRAALGGVTPTTAGLGPARRGGADTTARDPTGVLPEKATVDHVEDAYPGVPGDGQGTLVR